MAPSHGKHCARPLIGAYVSAGQSVHEVASKLALNFPGSQLKHAVLPGVVEKRPGGHESQNRRPGASPNFPAAQSVHSDCPTSALAFPGAHGKHDVAPGSVPNAPAGQG